MGGIIVNHRALLGPAPFLLLPCLQKNKNVKCEGKWKFQGLYERKLI